MKTTKKIGIWIEHSNANLMEFPVESIKTRTIASQNNIQDDEQKNFRSEKMMHSKEQHQLSEYYNKLGEVIENYEDVVLFGPTDAKVELLNILRADHRFEKINIELKQTDKMSEKQQHAFVREYFTGR